MRSPNAGCNDGEVAMPARLSPPETRAQDAAFVSSCSLAGLRSRLPLRWPAPSDILPSPKRTYRSHYTYLGWDDLENPAAWNHLSDFDIPLRVIDFSSLRPVLAQLLGWTSARGQIPFDPVSMFLLTGWQITHGWSRAQTLRNLSDSRYADYAQRFGFQEGVFPTEGGLRHFLTALGQNSQVDGEKIIVDADKGIEVALQRLNQLIAQSVTLIQQNRFLNPAAWDQALLCPDGMLHHAASRMRCASVTDSCYQSTTPDSPRPCPAKENDRKGCDCDTPACAEMCRYVTRRDRDARLVWYTGSNQTRDNPNHLTHNDSHPKRPHGKGVYGYRSLPLQLADSARRFSLVLLDDFLPANHREENPAAALLLQLSTHYPDLHPDAVAGDAGFGYDPFLHTVYHHLHARRVVDLRAYSTDRDKSKWPLRGYDDKGRPVCPFGYALTANGFDPQRQRYKWFCAHACRTREPLVQLAHVAYPPAECPYRGLPRGLIINVAEHFSDGSTRLARDVPVGSRSWKKLYHRARNAVEGRNATFKRWELKRLIFYGQPRNRALIFQADVWLNLTTMARLIREATAAAGTS